MSQLSAFLVLVLTAVVATGFSVDNGVRRGRQRWSGHEGHGSVSRFSHAGNSNRVVSSSQTAPQQPQNTKPPASICKAAGFFSNPGSDCQDFHRCVDWTGKGIRFSIFHFTCPAGTIFDNALSICNHPWAVKRPECIGYQEPAITTPTQSWTTPTTQSSTRPPTGPHTDGSTNVPPKPFTLECKQDNKYRRHPLYCNRYYYCIWDSATADWTFPSFTCPQQLLFDEHSQQCSASASPCDGILAPTDAVHNVTDQPTRPITSATTEIVTSDFMEFSTSTEKTWEVDPVSSYDCPAPGYYPFEGDCLRFYKCVETEQGKLKGLLYRCPNGYGYHEVMQRCRKEHELPTCTRVMTEALFRVEAARPLYVEDLKWFFVN